MRRVDCLSFFLVECCSLFGLLRLGPPASKANLAPSAVSARLRWGSWASWGAQGSWGFRDSEGLGFRVVRVRCILGVVRALGVHASYLISQG